MAEIRVRFADGFLTGFLHLPQPNRAAAEVALGETLARIELGELDVPVGRMHRVVTTTGDRLVVRVEDHGKQPRMICLAVEHRPLRR